MNNMRPPPPTAAAAAPPTAAAAARTVYEDFKPLSEWKQEHGGAHLLLIHLPGFTRDHIRVTSEPFNIIKVRGQRLLPPTNNMTNNNNISKWTRFNQDYAVPQDCTIRGIRAKLEAGILTITMPNKIILDHPPPKPTAVPPKNESPVENPPTPKKESPDEINKTTVENTPTPKNFIEKKIMDATTPSPPPKVEDKASTEAPKPPTSLEDRMKNIVHMPKDNKAEAENQKSRAEKEKDKEEVSPAAELKTKSLDYEEEEEAAEFSKKKDSTREKTNASEVDKFNKMVQGLTLRIKEDRESLVNVGVAVLILLALGIYVSQ